MRATTQQEDVTQVGRPPIFPDLDTAIEHTQLAQFGLQAIKQTVAELRTALLKIERGIEHAEERLRGSNQLIEQHKERGLRARRTVVNINGGSQFTVNG